MKIKMKKLFALAVVAVMFSSCLTNNYQYRKTYTRTATGIITKIYRNSAGGNTIVLDGKVNINVWDRDLDSTMVVGKLKTFQFKSLTRDIRK